MSVHVSSENPGNRPSNQDTSEHEYDERIRVLRKSLADVQKPESLKHRTGRNLLAHAELILDILDDIHDLHPFIGVATIPFKATLKIVLVKQDNDKRIAALVITMIDMMSALVELRHIKEQSSEATSGQSIPGNLTRVLTTIKVDIEEVGNIVDCYTKAHTWHRVLRCREWAEKFKDFAERFQKGKSDIQLALNMRTALAVDALQPKVDHVILLMQEWFLRPPSADERRMLDMVAQAQGSQKVLESETAFKTLYKEYGSGERARESGGVVETDTRSSDDSREKDREAREQWEELKGPLASLLSENRSIFEAKLEVQKRDLTSVIRQSETTIIRAINDGPHSYINNPAIRDLWKAMHWRLSVKTRHFVMALHDHYLHGLSHTPASRGFPTSASDPALGSPGPAVLVDPADKWCLQYLRIRHLPAISEAFDDDGSGFIKIGEVNDFTAGIPKDWTLLQWVAYWTAGWPTETGTYANWIRQTLVQIAEAQLSVKPENIEVVNDYMNEFALSEIQILVAPIQSDDTALGPELNRLVSSHRSQTEGAIRKNLETVKYNIDDPDSLSLICGPGRIEKYLLPLLHLMLLRHLEILRFSNKVALHPREMQGGRDSLYNVMERVWQRVTELKESFRQQKLDVNEQFKHFAGGIYSRYHYADPKRGIGLTPQLPESPDDNSESSSDSSWSDTASTFSEKVSGSIADTSGSSTPSGPGSPVPMDQKTPLDQPEAPHRDDFFETVPSTVATDVDFGTPDIRLKQDSNAATLPKAEDKTAEPDARTSKRSDIPTQPSDPTRYGPFTLNTRLYDEPPNITEETLLWRPLGVKFDVVGPLETFRLAAQRVLERIQLLSPRLTRTYIQRRREIRLKWLEIYLRPDTLYLGGDQYEDQELSKQKELDDLNLQITPADVSYYTSLANIEIRLRAIHIGRFCDGCDLQIVGKRFHCIDCSDFDLCNECEYAEAPKYDIKQHPQLHTMVKCPYPIESTPARVFERRARKYMVTHARLQCSCSNIGGEGAAGTSESVSRCDGCHKELRNEIHFRCLQCPNYDLCENCERDSPSGHCVAHAMLKLKAPFLEQRSNGSDEEEEESLSVDARLAQLAKRMSDMETKFGSRLDELQQSFTRVVALLEKSTKQGSGDVHK